MSRFLYRFPFTLLFLFRCRFRFRFRFLFPFRSYSGFRFTAFPDARFHRISSNVRCHFCRLPRSRFLGTSVYIDLPISSSSDKHSSLHLQYHFYHCGVGLYINELIPYRILEKESTSSFQALWCEFNMRKGKKHQLWSGL